MRFRRGLKRLRDEAQPVVESKEVRPPSELRRTIEAFLERDRRRPKADAPSTAGPRDLSALPGRRVQTAAGSMRLVEQRFSVDHCHGHAPVRRALDVTPATLARLCRDDQIRSIPPGRLLFFDTETTGLSIGGGTLPFLVGLGWFEDDIFIVHQALIESPGDEPAMLEWLRDHLVRASCVVSYNGKSYDWPLLRTRFVLNRIAAPVVEHHVDLLHCARRIVKRRLGGARLVRIESEVLGFSRVDDIEGHLIPERYWSFVRGAPAAGLVPVIEHNLHDIVALAAAMGWLGDAYEERLDVFGEDALGLAWLALKNGDLGRAARFAEQVRHKQPELAAEAALLIARLYRRLGRVADATAALHRVVESSTTDAAGIDQIHLALAKLYEHKLRDFDRAMAHAHAGRTCEGEDAHLRRVARLHRRRQPTA